MAKSKNKTENFLSAAQTMIENTIANPAIKTAMANYGYDEAKLQAGKSLYDEALELNQAQKKESGGNAIETAELNNLWLEADQQYLKTLKIARIVLKDLFRIDQATMLYGVRKQSFNGWKEQALSFYASILKDTPLIHAMARYGYSRAKLQQEFELIKTVVAKQTQQQREQGQPQPTASLRDKKLDELAVYISEMCGIAKVALADTPDYLQKLGIMAGTGFTHRKQKEPAATTEPKQ